jgi:hypothetical protein
MNAIYDWVFTELVPCAGECVPAKGNDLFKCVRIWLVLVSFH